MDTTESQTYTSIWLEMRLRVAQSASRCFKFAASPPILTSVGPTSGESTGRQNATCSGVEGEYSEENGVAMHWKDRLLLSTQPHRSPLYYFQSHHFKYWQRAVFDSTIKISTLILQNLGRPDRCLILERHHHRWHVYSVGNDWEICWLHLITFVKYYLLGECPCRCLPAISQPFYFSINYCNSCVR